MLRFFSVVMLGLIALPILQGCGSDESPDDAVDSSGDSDDDSSEANDDTTEDDSDSADDSAPDDSAPDDSAPDDEPDAGTPDDTPDDSSQACPPTCFVPYMCVNECGEEPRDMGCCPCPEGMLNAEVECRDEPADCGDVGSTCEADADCPEDLSCEAGVCAPSTGVCGVPPEGTICPLSESCLLRANSTLGICVPNEDVDCVCNDVGRRNFFCTP